MDGIRAIVVDLRSLALADAPITDMAPVNLTEIVGEASDIIAALGELRDVTVRHSAERGTAVRGAPTRLKQVVLNLGDNAVKYTPAGGQVTIRLDVTDGSAILRITDTGIGISRSICPGCSTACFGQSPPANAPRGRGLAWRL